MKVRGFFLNYETKAGFFCSGFWEGKIGVFIVCCRICLQRQTWYWFWYLTKPANKNKKSDPVTKIGIEFGAKKKMLLDLEMFP